MRRLIANELILSFVPDGEQRIWRSMTRMKLQLTRDRVRLQNQMECLLEEMRKISVYLFIAAMASIASSRSRRTETEDLHVSQVWSEWPYREKRKSLLRPVLVERSPPSFLHNQSYVTDATPYLGGGNCETGALPLRKGK